MPVYNEEKTVKMVVEQVLKQERVVTAGKNVEQSCIL